LEDIKEKIKEIDPKTIVYLFSGGKDSSVALIKTRDFVKEYAKKNNIKVFILYVYIPGNTHPLNAYCSYAIMLWHKKNYGFEPQYGMEPKLFQELVAKYGLTRKSKRWCYIEFKDHVFRRFHRSYEKPVLYINGMKPSDSQRRRRVIKSELEYIKCYFGSYWVWHPLYYIKSNEEVFEILKKHKEFSCVLELYQRFGDSLNCVLCPYWSKEKILKYYSVEGDKIIYCFLQQAIRSKHYLEKYKPTSEK